MIDTHCHLYRENLPEIKEILQNAEKNWVKKFLNIWIDLKTSKKAFNQAKNNKNIFFSVWIHPCDSWKFDFWDQKYWKEFENLFQEKKCLAIWECGFDFYREPFDQKIQEKVFIKQRDLARKYNLPIIIHNRNAKMKIFDFLKKWDEFVIHCFSENQEFANKVLEYWWMISIWWILTYPKSNELREIIKNFPLDRIMLETDSPFLAPQWNRWKVNQPAFMREVAIKISELKNISLDLVIKKTSENAQNFYKI